MDLQTYFKVTYGLYVVTAKSSNKLYGYVANTVFQITADPPRFAISCSKANHSHQAIQESGNFSFSILSADCPSELIQRFGYNSGVDIDKFEGVSYFYDQSGSPIVADGVVGWFDCKVTQIIDVGTHTLFIGDVLAYDLVKDAPPLTYGDFRALRNGASPKNAPTYIDHSELEDKATENEEVHQCQICNYKYHQSEGDQMTSVDPGTPFEELDEDWKCPVCGATKDMFSKL